jgi:hypothetical protein
MACRFLSLKCRRLVSKTYGINTYCRQRQLLKRFLRNHLALWLAVKTGKTGIAGLLLAISTNLKPADYRFSRFHPSWITAVTVARAG